MKIEIIQFLLSVEIEIPFSLKLNVKILERC